MLFARFKAFITSNTMRLAGTYLAIIMLMSVGFSIVLYRTSSQVLGRQIPPSSLIFQNGQANPNLNLDGQALNQNSTTSPPALDKFLQQRINQGRTSLQYRLLIINISALAIGSIISYVLARRQLLPIEQAMEAQSQFISDASHELRTPITAMQTSNEVALRRKNLTLRDARELIEQNADDLLRLKELSDALLNLAAHSKAEPIYAPINLQDATSSAMTQIVRQATLKDIAVHDEVANMSVLGNMSALVQVLIILLDNAVKYSDPKKNIYLKSRCKGKFVYLDVIDEGMGIRASDIAHLFRRFYRVDNSRTGGERSGYGLGLAIAESIMENHNGKISVTSKLGEGSIFTIRLNLA